MRTTAGRSSMRCRYGPELRVLARRPLVGEIAGPAAQREDVGIERAVLRAAEPALAVARQLGIELPEQRRDLALGVPLDLGGAGGVAFVHPAVGVEVDDQGGLQRVGQPHQPLVEVRPLGAAQRRREPGLRMGVAQVQRDGRGFVQDQVAVDQHRDQAVGIEPQIGRLLVGLGRARNQHPLVGHADFLEQDVRHHGGGARVVMQLDHFTPNRLAPLSHAMPRATSAGRSPSQAR